jgi:protein-tyrosine phosphatase
MDGLVAERLVQFSSKGVPKADEFLRGPTSTSCWIVPGLVLWGDMPKGPKLAALVDAGTTHFLDLRSHASHYVEPPLTYINMDLKSILSSNSQQAIAQFAFDLKQILNATLRDERGILYVHCDDGHSPSAVVASILVAMVYGLSGMKAVTVVSQIHGARMDNGGAQHLLTVQQKSFVRDATNSAPPESQSLSLSSSDLGSRPTSRFGHSRGGGGGFTSINLFGDAPEAKPSQGRGPPPSTALSLSPKALVLPSAQAAERLAHSTPQRSHIESPPQSQRSLTSAGRSPSNRTSPIQEGHAMPPHSGHLQSFTTVIERSTLAHAWGLVMSGTTVRYVLPRSPAEAANLKPGDVVRAIDNGEFTSDQSFDWVAQDSLFVRLSVAVVGDTTPTSVTGGDSPLTVHTPSVKFVVPAMFQTRSEAHLIRGPFSHSNWVVGDRVLCGPVPDPRRKAAFDALCKAKITVFVNLLENDGTLDHYLRPYRDATGNEAVSQISFPLQDGFPMPFARFEELALVLRQIVDSIIEGEGRVYIHCKNGHGRTGIVVSCLLATLYHLPGMRAVNFCDSLHSCRVDTEDQSSPQTQEQRLSVLEFVSKIIGA